MFVCLFIYLFILRERERARAREHALAWAGEGQREGERESQAGSLQSAWSPTPGLNPRTMRSWPELKSRVRCLSDWATQVSLNLIWTAPYWTRQIRTESSVDFYNLETGGIHGDLNVREYSGWWLWTDNTSHLLQDLSEPRDQVHVPQDHIHWPYFPF